MAQQPGVQDPVINFDAFYKVFNDNYAFFSLHKVNWQAPYKKYRLKVNAGISSDSLFNVMSAMLKPLGDSHVNLIDAEHRKKFNAAGPSQFMSEFDTDSLRKTFWQTADTTLARNGFKDLRGYGPFFKNKPLFYFTVNDSYAYLRITRCFAYIKDGEIDEENLEMRVLDSLMASHRDLKGIMIDIRGNIGGDDKFSYEVAGRFTAAPVTGHLKQERIASTAKYTKLKKWIIVPKGSVPFTNPVVLLTNDKTVSAAEVLALAMKQLPQVAIIGSNTEGNLSDMFSQDLPNGWTVTLSNQRYYSPAMVCYEGKGIPVDEKVLNTRDDLAAKRDKVIERALKVLPE